MIVTTDTDASKLGLSPAEIAGVMGLQPGELHVHVVQVLGGEPHIPSLVVAPLPPLERLHLEDEGGVEGAPTLSLETQATEVRATDFRSDAPAIPPTNLLGLPPTDAPSKPTMRLEDSAFGMTGNSIDKLAEAMRCGIVREADGRITLVSVLVGSHTFPDSNHAVIALRRGSFT